jgi:hypothetical protein
MVHEPQIGFVDQCGALKSVADPLRFEMVMGEAPKLVINQRQ